MRLTNWRDYLKLLLPTANHNSHGRSHGRKSRRSQPAVVQSVEALEVRVVPTAYALGIDGLSPSTGAVTAKSISYLVTFDDAVVGVDPSDFAAVTTGSAKAHGSITIVPDANDHSVYTVTINGLSGTGDVRLVLLDDDSIVHEFPQVEDEPLGGIGPGNGGFQGNAYQLLPAYPTVVSINRDVPTDDVAYATSITYTVTFSTAVTGVDAGDFQLVLTGTTVDLPISVSGSGSTYTVSIAGISGNGSIGLNLIDDGSIHDLVGNPLGQSELAAAFLPESTVNFGANTIDVATNDFNGDGNQDLIAISAGDGANYLQLALGNGDGTFQAASSAPFYPIGADPIRLATRDFDGDGKVDVMVLVPDFEVNFILYRGNGDGSFQFPLAFNAGSDAAALVAANLYDNGIPQLITVNPIANTVTVISMIEGSYGVSQVLETGAGPVAISVGDFNGDGRLDIATANQDDDTVSILFRLDGGSFGTAQSVATGVSPRAITAADFNGDGILDLATGNAASNDVSVLLGVGDGTFSPPVSYAAGSSPLDVRTTDVNGDGFYDLVVANSDGAVGALMGRGDGTFESFQTFVTNRMPVALAIGDVNNDGRPDVLTADISDAFLLVSLNATRGHFTGEVYNRFNASPTITPTGTIEVFENLPTTTDAYQFLATDPEQPGQTLTFHITGPDAELFTLDPQTGSIRFNQVPDFEAPADAGGDNDYNLTLSVSDGFGGTASREVVISVKPLNDNLPVFTSSDVAYVSENFSTTDVVLDVDATDADLPGQVVTYSLSGADAGKFVIDPDTGEIRFRASPDYENPDDEGRDYVYDLVVTASDGQGGAETQAVTVRLYPMNDNLPVITSASSVDVPENTPDTDVILQAAATDADLPTPTMYFELGGADAERFSIDGLTGEIRFLFSPDYESPLDLNGDNVYEVTLFVYDGGEGSLTQELTIRVLPLNDNSPVFEIPETVLIDENAPPESILQTVVASDFDQPAQGLDFSLSGADASLFTINSAGQIRFLKSPNFEDPDDLNGDNDYEIIVTVTDSGDPALATSRPLTIRVLDANDAPIADSDTLIVLENTAQNGQLSGFDPDVEPQTTYSIVDQPTHGTVVLTNTFTGEYTYTPDTDYTGPDSFTFKIFDGELESNIATVTITVTALNSPPEVSNATLDIFENSSNGTVLGTVVATDPDVVPGPGSDVLTYAITGGNTNDAFSIDPSNGEIRVSNKAALNFEVLQQIVLQVSVTDLAAHTSFATITVNILNVNEPLIITLPSATPVFHKDGSPTPIDTAATVYDEDLTPIEFRGGVLTITVTREGDPDPNDRLSVEVQGTGAGKISLVSNYIVYDSPLNIIGTIASGLDGGPLVINLTSFANEESVGALLRTINYSNVGANPLPGNRTITFDLTDGPGENSGTQTKQLELITVSDPPVVTLPPGSLNLPRGASPTPLGGTAIVTDPDSSSFKGGQLVVTAIQGANRSDRLRILKTGGIKVTGKDVLFNGQKIGRLTRGKNSIDIDFTTNSATPAAVQALIRAIAFSTSRSRKSVGERLYQFNLSDGAGGRQTTVQSVVVADRVS